MGAIASYDGTKGRHLIATVVACLCCSAVVAQFNTPVVNGSIGANEYGLHTQGNNLSTNTVNWYLTWDATNLYVGISGASNNASEPAILYMDVDPLVPVNALGANANGSLTGFSYDGITCELPFRADFVLYLKSGYHEFRLRDGSGSWTAQTANSLGYSESGSGANATQEISIPWSSITGGGALPASFNWLGQKQYNTGVYGQIPAENPTGSFSFGTTISLVRYHTVVNTSNGSATKPFALNSYTHPAGSSNNAFGAISVYDFTMNSTGQQISRTGGGNWVVSGSLVVANGTIYFGNAGPFGTSSVNNLQILGGVLNMDAASQPLQISGNLSQSEGTLTMSSAVGGDLYLQGNFTKTGGIFNCNNRELRFNGSGAQAYQSSQTENINFLRNAKTGGTLTINSSINVLASGGVTLTAAATTFGAGTTLTLNDNVTWISSSGSVTINGTMRNTGPTGVTDFNSSTANLSFGTTGVYEHNVTRAGTSIGPIPAAQWQTGSKCEINALTNPTAGSWPTNTSGISFYDFVWNTPSLTTSPLLSTNLTVTGTLTIQSTGSSSIRLSSNTNRTITTRNYAQSGGTLNLTDGSATNNLLITGNFSHTGGTITSSGASSTCSVQFNGTSNQTLVFNATVSGNVNLLFNNASGFTISGTVTVPANRSVTMTNGSFTGAGSIQYDNNGTTLIYNGSAATTTSAYEFPASNGPSNLTINDAANVTLHAARSISGVLTLSNGKLITTSTNVLTLSSVASGAVLGGSAASYVQGPLRRAMASNTTYSFPVGSASTYLPAELSVVNGVSPVVQVESFAANCNGTVDGTVSAISTTEYWQAQVVSGSLSAASISLTREAGIGGLTAIARSTTGAAGVYGSLGGSVLGNTISNGVTGGILGHFVLASATPAYYWSNAVSMNWGTATSWLVTSTASFVNPYTPSVPPNALNSLGITIRTGHTVSTSGTNISLDQTTIESGAVLNYNGGSIAVTDGTGEDIVIESGGKFTHAANDLSAPTLASGVIWRIKTGASIEINHNLPGGEADYYASNENPQYASSMVWENGSVFVWNASIPLTSTGVTYFPNANSSTIPVFRINSSIGLGVGANSPTTINGLLEVNGSVTWQNTGTKTFRNGIIGTGTITQGTTGPCGAFIINGTTSQLGGTGSIQLTGNGMQIAAGTCTLISNKAINTSAGGIVTIANGATLDASTFSLTGSAGFTHQAGATLITANAAGVNGTVQLTGTKSFQDFANYTFNGTTNQVTGSLMGTVIFNLNINNGGAAGSNTVTLTNNATKPAAGNTTTRNLNLNSGLFSIGSGGYLYLEGVYTSSPSPACTPCAEITGSGGNMVAGVAGGTIFIEGPANVNSNTTGWPSLNNVILQNSGIGIGVNFLSNATISTTLTINTQGFVNPNAPTFASGSTLVYNSGGSYNRSVEWGQVTAGQPGYPHHVTVQNGTYLNIGLNNPPSLSIGGNLTIGTSSSTATVDMNATNVDLVVNGNLTIGTATSTGSELKLSTAFDGDLWLYGNFTRYNNNYYTDNNRAIFFKGNNASVTVSTPNVTITPGVPTQYFSYAYVDKDAGTEKITLNCPVGISQQIGFTKGIIVSTETNILQVTNAAVDAVIGGSALSFVSGMMERNTGTSGTYLFPIGKTGGVAPYGSYRQAYVKPTTAGFYKAEYFQLTGPNIPGVKLMTGVLKTEHWLVKPTTGSGNAAVGLVYINPNDDAAWYDVGPAGCYNCNVAVAKNFTNTATPTWAFTDYQNGQGSGFNSATPEYRFWQDNGLIWSKPMTSYWNTSSYYTIGYEYNVILPLKLLAFNAKLHGNNGLLEWSVDSDKDLQHFELEHSSNGNNFTVVYISGPNGRNYAYTHQNLKPGLHYYRLKMKERNGNTTQSKVIVLSVIEAGFRIMGLQQNASQDMLITNLWSDKVTNVTLVFSDVSGRVLKKQTQEIQAGSTQLRLMTSGFSRGQYFLSAITGEGKIQTIKWIKL